MLLPSLLAAGTEQAWGLRWLGARRWDWCRYWRRAVRSRGGTWGEEEWKDWRLDQVSLISGLRSTIRSRKTTILPHKPHHRRQPILPQHVHRSDADWTRSVPVIQTGPSRKSSTDAPQSVVPWLGLCLKNKHDNCNGTLRLRSSCWSNWGKFDKKHPNHASWRV